MEINPQTAYTVRQAAALLNLSERRIQELINPKPGHKVQLPSRKFGRDWQIAGADLIAFKAKDRPAHRPRKQRL